MSWALRFLKRVRRETPEYLTSSTLKLVELQQASLEIVRLVQCQHFLEEYLCLKEGRQVKRHSKLANLSPILIDDVIRVCVCVCVWGGGGEFAGRQSLLTPHTK